MAIQHTLTKKKDLERKAQQSHMITKVLSPAVQLWLRSQVQQVKHLEVKIFGGDRQILSGHIPHVFISAQNAVYQGLYLTHLELEGKSIRINLGGVLRGQPLRLLEPISIFGEVRLDESDLNASLKSPLLTEALTTLLKTFLPDKMMHQAVNWEQMTIGSDRLTIKGTIANDQGTIPIILDAELRLISSHELALKKLQIHSQLGLHEIDNYYIDLGSEVAIEKLNLNSGQLLCCGRLNVLP